MEAGYDYLLVRGRLKRRFFTLSGVILSILGVMLLVGGGAYYGYAAKARADLGDLAAGPPGHNQGDSGIVDDSESEDPSEASVPPGFSAEAVAGWQPYPGDTLLARSWSNPLADDPTGFWEQALIQQFTPLGDGGEPNEILSVGQGSPATRIVVPSAGIDSVVTELAVLDLGDSRAYETPAFTVGHIPESANAGEAGSAWFFGHLESPIRSEGSVFYNLQDIPDRLRAGEDVYIFTDNGEGQYLYRVISTEVVHERDMKLHNTGKATIHLVTCVPRLVYDHRLIVTGELVGTR